ncbi:MAG: ATP-dependent protease LonB [Candidatus Micrarchaeota archaeon]|nr:ATP-dependent protease LonB [Candidatus Micrarchaeota archaeon]
MKEFDFKDTSRINVPEKLVDQIIGQKKAVDIVRTAAKQKRHILLIGPPGTGKSLIGQAMAELLPLETLDDYLAYPNNIMENEPFIRNVRTYPDFKYLQDHPEYMKYYNRDELDKIRQHSDKAKYSELVDALRIGLGRRIVMKMNFGPIAPQKQDSGPSPFTTIIFMMFIGVILLFLEIPEYMKWFLLSLLIGAGIVYSMLSFFSAMPKGFTTNKEATPKLLVDNTGKKFAPFVDATGAKAGALLGDVKHDPLQSGGLGTPAHLRVEAGAIHKANKGVLFTDEIASLKLNWQQEILTAMQEKKYSITGQSELSSGALVKTQAAPCDFVLVAAGNINDMNALHPAFRSRIRGSGYEVYMESEMNDTAENRAHLARFIAQEIKKDGKIPNFSRDSVLEIVDEARKMAGRKGKLTLRLRELGGLIRAAGDIALKENSALVEPSHIHKAKKIFSTIEVQVADQIIERKKEYEVIKSRGHEIGRVNGLAILGESNKGMMLPIVAEVAPASSAAEGRIIATGKLGKIAKEAVRNVSAIIKKYIGTDISKKDIHVQFLQTYEGVEGDSASVSVAVAVFSALQNIQVNQAVAMTGSLDVRGNVLPVGGVSGKIRAAFDSGIRTVIIPKSNLKDVYLDKEIINKVKVIGVERIEQVIKNSFKSSKDTDELIRKLSGKK